MNKFILFLLLTLFIQYAVTETKNKAKATKAKEEDVAATDLSSSVTSGRTSREGSNTLINENIVTPAPENILNTPTTIGYNHNPIFNGEEEAHNQYGYVGKYHTTNYKPVTYDNYNADLYNYDGKYSNTNFYQNSPYNFNQGKYFSNYNYAGKQNYPSYYDNGSYKQSSHNFSLYSGNNPGYYSGAQYPYSQTFSNYQPFTSGYYSGKQGYYQAGLSDNQGAYKSGFGSSYFTSTPASVVKSSSSGIGSGSSGNTGEGIFNSGTYKSGYQYNFPSYSGYYGNQYKPYSSGGYDSGKYSYNYPGYQSGYQGSYYSQGYSAYGSGGVTPTTSTPSSISYSSGSKTPGSVDGYKSFSQSYPYNYQGYQSSFYNSGATRPYNYQAYNFSKFNKNTYQSSVGKTSQPLSSISTATSGSVGSGAGISSFDKSKPAPLVGSFGYPGYNNYQTNTYDYNAYKQYPGYSSYDYSKYYTSPGYQINKATGYNTFSSGVTSTPSTSTISPFTSTSKASVTPSIVSNIIPSTAVPPTTVGKGYYQSTYPGYNYPFHGYNSGNYNDGSYKQSFYDTNPYLNNAAYKSTGIYSPGRFSSSIFPATSSPAPPVFSSGISSQSGSYLDAKAVGNSGSGVNRNIQTSLSGSYDFSNYGKKVPSTISTISPVNPSFYNYQGYQPYTTDKYNAGKYDYTGYQYSSYNYPSYPTEYYGSGYKYGPLVSSNFTGYNSGSNNYLGSFSHDGIYHPSSQAEIHGYSGYNSGVYPADYHEGTYHYNHGKGYHQDGLYPGQVSSHLTSDHIAFSSTAAPVTSTKEATKLK